MARPSSIKTLPEDVRKTLDALLRQDRTTQLAILELVNAELAKLGKGRVSRSSLSRYAVRMREAGKKIRQAREVAKAWVGEIGEEPAGEVGRLMIELVRTMAFDAASEVMQGDKPATAKVIGALASAIRDLEFAAKLSADRELSIRKEVAKEAAKVAKQGARRAGLSPEAIAMIERDVLGIVRS